ncbi:DUF6573 family protein [Streptomyces olivoreticuli]|uniref:DUF6573 family protein n=1 Tax=Streptomyces olivoreticuli TaxID=68246 RepID=UPI000E221D57|nr:DUF6573 family protein [Streptomyces olivoreticuli]
MDEDYGPVVAAYTRAEAFADGTFIPIVPAAGSAVGIEMPLIITASAWQEFVAGDREGGGERLRTVLSAVAKAVEQAPANEVCFVVPAQELPSGDAPTGADRLLAITEPGDTGKPVMTLILPHEM